MYETILIDGTDIKVSGIRLLTVWEEVLGTPDLRGEDLIVVDADGADDVDDRAFEPFVVNVGLMLRGGDNAGFNDAYRTLRRLVKVDGTVTMTRRMSFGSGNEEHTCLARYVSGLGPSTFGMIDADLTLGMKNLNGLWYGPSTTISSGGTVAVAGDVRTRRMTVTFSGGTNPTLTNSTTGDALLWSGSPGGTPVIIDVETMTATRGGTNVSGQLSWTRTFPMTLKAGNNSLALTGGGSFAVAYRPAYL